MLETTAWSALSYEPARDDSGSDEAPLALDRLAEESAIVLGGENEKSSKSCCALTALRPAGDPRSVAHVSADKSRIMHGRQKLRPGFTHWIIKFASSQDPSDVGAIENAYSLMARNAVGVEMPGDASVPHEENGRISAPSAVLTAKERPAFARTQPRGVDARRSPHTNTRLRHDSARSPRC